MCGEVIPVRTVGHGADMTVNVSSIAAVVTADGCRVVVHARNTIGNLGDAVRHGRYTVRHRWNTVKCVCHTNETVNHSIQI